MEYDIPTIKKSCIDIATSLFRCTDPKGWIDAVTLIDQTEDPEKLKTYQTNLANQYVKRDLGLQAFLKIGAKCNNRTDTSAPGTSISRCSPLTIKPKSRSTKTVRSRAR